ncbi:MAG: hypothetical protein AB7F96_21640 [Beijerinckiaceae bacterium]
MIRRDRISAGEWELRRQLAEAYRLVAHGALVDMTYNHISAREACEEQARKFGRIGHYNFASRDRVASMAQADRNLPEFR